MTTFAAGTLVRARDREWVVQPDSTSEFIILRPLGGTDDDVTAVFPSLEPVSPASFPPPTADDLGDHSSARMLRDALRVGFRSSAGPFRSLASLAVEPRSYQLVPLLMAMRQDTVRLLISDDVGIGKTVEAALIAKELLATGQAHGLTVLCSPALAEQWQSELRDKFGMDAVLVLPSTVNRLQRGLGMDESIFERYPITVVSTDFIKSAVRRDEFVRAAPDLLIVDEAHTSVSDGAGTLNKGTTQRHDLLKRLAADPQRHLILVTATPHSGQEAGFRNLIALLDPRLETVELDTSSGRARLAEHFVQRRRKNIRKYLDQDTPFPADRLTQERSYALAPEYRKLFEAVLDYARESVTDPGATGPRQRVRWWSALALLRSLASSPAAAADTLRKRALNASAASVEEADALGRQAVMDVPSEDEAMEGMDVAPGAQTESEAGRLLRMAKQADALYGPEHDAKLADVTKVVKGLLADGFDPIVFCRFIPTAEYVGAHLTEALKRRTDVGVVTGTLPPSERVARIAALSEHEGRHVLVATDCLSEGVNLQDNFQAVVHYDLAWNPTRHEQREGRVDRFGQAANEVRAVTLFGADNQIDGLVMEILLRKHQAIRKDTGVSVPVPATSDTVVQAVLEGLLLRGDDYRGEQLSIEGIADEQRGALDEAWNSAAEKEKASREKYAQEGIKPEEVAAEVAAIRAALGSGGDVDGLVTSALSALGGDIVTTEYGFNARTNGLPSALRDSLTPGHHEPLPFHRTPPAPRRSAVLARTDPDVEAIAAFVLDAALDPKSLPADLGKRLARRAGVFRSPVATRRVTVLLLRHRMHLSVPGRTGTTQHVVEHAQMVGVTIDGQWLPESQVMTLVESPASATGNDQAAIDQIERSLEQLPSLAGDLDQFANEVAEQTEQAHRRVRRAIADRLRGLKVEPILPVDVLGVWVYLPKVGA